VGYLGGLAYDQGTTAPLHQTTSLAVAFPSSAGTGSHGLMVT